MTEYIITEEQIKRYRLENYIVPDDLKILASDETRSRPLSKALEESYKNGFNDGQAEGMPEALKAERERVLPNDEELKALKHVVCFAIQHHLFDAERADNYYHKLKSLRSEP